jgi:hypothetical protein
VPGPPALDAVTEQAGKVLGGVLGGGRPGQQAPASPGQSEALLDFLLQP